MNTTLLGQLGSSLEMFQNKYGEAATVWEHYPMLFEHVFDKDGIKVSVRCVDDQAERIEYTFTMPLSRALLIDYLGRNEQGSEWDTVTAVSSMEKRDIHQAISLDFPGFKKYTRSDGQAFAYYYQTVWDSAEYKLQFITSEYFQAVAEAIPDYVEGEKLYHQTVRLKYSYFTDSEELLGDYFDIWAQESSPISPAERRKLPNLIQEAYKIFEDFYTPTNLGRIAQPEWGDTLYNNVHFYIVQHSLDISTRNDIALSDTDFVRYKREPILQIEVKNFRPSIKDASVQVCYLTDRYKERLLEFLGDEHVPLGEFNIMAPAYEIGESRNRSLFLGKKMRLFHGHWGGWILLTHPYVQSIDFNETLDEAIVRFAIIYEGGYAHYKKHRGKWRLINSKLTWIQ